MFGHKQHKFLAQVVKLVYKLLVLFGHKLFYWSCYSLQFFFVQHVFLDSAVKMYNKNVYYRLYIYYI